MAQPAVTTDLRKSQRPHADQSHRDPTRNARGRAGDEAMLSSKVIVTGTRGDGLGRTPVVQGAQCHVRGRPQTPGSTS